MVVTKKRLDSRRHLEIRKRRYADYKVLATNAVRKHRGASLPTRPAPETCELCGRLPGVRGLHSDHDHETGRFRGWLCLGCNTAIGKLGDNEAGLRRALEYITCGTTG